MPIYEFYCPKNNKIYTFLARSLALSGSTPRCPDNPKFPLERMISSFAVTGRAKEQPETPAGGAPDDPRMEAAMAEMEREFSGMDTDNPDPRQLARMMRRMSALTGEKMPGQMEEMIGRLEAGEDPEALEEAMGGAMDDFDPSGEGGEPGDAGDQSLKARLAALRRHPARDPVLYEMSEFVD